ncbi:MAG TPA: ribbon-helix-helix domain-containing protein [Stellaceae bacterium]|nr:ribbon-helix-helix domain-containing protein [Stellaceae bacterium]
MRRRRRGGAKAQQEPVWIELDPLIWEALQDIAAQQGRGVGDLVTEIAHDSLRVAIHVYIAEFYNLDLTEGGEDGRIE